MTKIVGIEFAPLRIPLERRLQTAAVLKWTLSFLCLGFGCFFLNIYLLLFTEYYWVPLGYLCWYLYDRRTPERGGRRVRWFRRWAVWRYMRDYFPIALHKTADLDPKKNYLLGYHPHGVMCTGAFCNFATDATDWDDKFPHHRPYLLTLAGQFMFPVFREYFMTTGSVSCTKDSIRWHLSENGVGNALILIVGGAVEALEARPGNFKLKLKSRKGFIKLALENGASLVPMYSFGENDLFDQAPNPTGSKVRDFQDWMTKRLGFSVPFFHGRGVFNYTVGLLPFRRPINTVVGTPIDVERTPNPTQRQIDELHTRYMESLDKLFEDHKSKFNVGDKEHLEFM